MRNSTTLKLAVALLLTSATTLKAQQRKLSSYVNTFIGTAPMNDPKILGYELPKDWRSWAGLTFPGSALPNAMVQLSPITQYGSGAGYQYEDDTILGFTHTNKGHWNLCNVPLMPVSGKGGKFSSHFSHQKESASPGFYRVYLNDQKVNVSLTSTLRAGFHRYEFDSNTDRSILFDLAKANNRVNDWKIEQVGNALQGYQNVGEVIYFYAVVNSKIDSVEKRNEGKRDGYALAHISNQSKGPVEVKIGLSFVSMANAKLNLEQELGNKTFEQVRTDAANIWENTLAKIQVKGGEEKDRRMFYSSLYRSLLWPCLRSDANGEYTDVKKQVVKGDFRYYTDPSLWDTYRNKDVLLGLLFPKVTTDVIKSLKDHGDKTGFIPTFFHGDHAASSIAGAYLRGITDFDIKDTYRLLLRNANIEGGTRPFISEYIKNGYIAEPEQPNPNVETKGKASVSKTLEYAYDDYSVAQLAKALGDTANYRILMARSKNYKNVFDKRVNFMRGRQPNGEWIQNFNPQYPYYEYMFREANAWQVSFYAPHDMPGLVELYGGKKKFEAKLDSLFTVPWNPEYKARNVETMIGQYCQGNQPDHEAPFAYYFVGKPEKSQRKLDYIMKNLYGIGKEGLELSGMDDAGEMSSWYVLTSLGLYTFSATDPQYLVTVPLFDEVKWTTSNGKVLTIKKPGKSRNLKDIKVNGKSIKGYFVPHSLFKTGGTIEVVTR
ncbi:glycoside hydrolase family 92 protein [Mucilaginibacter achroorhodeus]|uniref:Glycoside hydrolase family 92 protein n=1 Tax=Mucilaginibacter achroorhodeus TaxID=2599294 RepID=A0A563U2P2_9SPHI|nr:MULTISPECIES: GH92 family glycosyl hydrolase [Mucilaginibacter]QXV64152.1 GH92 family glycosyl hydrolase [Mucilaginibacter sp. 21P]TWR25602.1 glycoside hydrolase family 92 protein [Mucilaginibacter achroorhodeus]